MVKVKQEKFIIQPHEIKPSSKKLEVLGTFNPAAARLSNGEIIIYVRVIERLIKTEDKKYYYSPRMIGEEKFKLKIDKFNKKLVSHKSDFDFIFEDGTKRLTYISHLRKVTLNPGGFQVKSIDKKPSFYGLAWDGELGIEDARITKINELYVMTYVSLSRKENISTSYAISNDCIRWYRRGIIFREQNKDVVLFPELVKGRYVAFNRPEGSFQFSLPHIWVSYSKDLESWGDDKPINFSKPNEWDSGRVGAGPPPIKTEKGWLLIYHGVIEPKRKKMKEKILKRMNIPDLYEDDESVYCAGAALFDLDIPHKLIAKTKVPILIPLRKKEIGSLEDKSVIFPTGLILDKNKKDILVYSGAGDRFVVVKKMEIKKILSKLSKVKGKN